MSASQTKCILARRPHEPEKPDVDTEVQDRHDRDAPERKGRQVLPRFAQHHGREHRDRGSVALRHFRPAPEVHRGGGGAGQSRLHPEERAVPGVRDFREEGRHPVRRAPPERRRSRHRRLEQHRPRPADLSGQLGRGDPGAEGRQGVGQRFLTCAVVG